MIRAARRLLLLCAQRPARRAILALCLWPAMAAADVIDAARYTDPTTRYAHGVLGDAIEHGTLELILSGGRRVSLTLPQSDVFEDTAPRLADLDGDGDAEVIVVQSNDRLGAKLAIYDETGLVAATPNIGMRNRWLAPLGAADLDGDGMMEIAYIDRPHLAKTLHVWRFENDTLRPVASLPGYTNHRIGETDIAGGIRTCAGSPEMIVASADWSGLVALRFDGALFSGTLLGTDTTRPAFSDAMACK